MDRSARREQVLACAVKVFSRKGYHATTVSDIIAEAGVARGTFYLYFKSKRAIFDEVLDDFLALLRKQFPRVQIEESESLVDQVIGNVERALAVLVDNQELTRILLHEAVGLDADFDAKLSRFYGEVTSFAEGSLRLGQQMGIIAPCDVRVASWCILGTVKEVVDQAISHPELLPDRSVLSREMLQVILGGVAAPDLRDALLSEETQQQHHQNAGEPENAAPAHNGSNAGG